MSGRTEGSFRLTKTIKTHNILKVAKTAVNHQIDVKTRGESSLMFEKNILHVGVFYGAFTEITCTRNKTGMILSIKVCLSL